jgi:hypothetical protein
MLLSIVSPFLPAALRIALHLYEKVVKVKADVAAILRTFFLAPLQYFDCRFPILNR